MSILTKPVDDMLHERSELIDKLAAVTAERDSFKARYSITRRAISRLANDVELIVEEMRRIAYGAIEQTDAVIDAAKKGVNHERSN